MKIIIGSDHAGFNLKKNIIEQLQKKNYTILDKGTSSEASVDYPDFAHLVAVEVANDQNNIGILICGSANGVSIVANKHKMIRCALCWNVEIAELARKHNNANILALPARFLTIDQAIEITDIFLNTDFEAGRHLLRVNKIEC